MVHSIFKSRGKSVFKILYNVSSYLCKNILCRETIGRPHQAVNHGYLWLVRLMIFFLSASLHNYSLKVFSRKLLCWLSNDYKWNPCEVLWVEERSVGAYISSCLVHNYNQWLQRPYSALHILIDFPNWGTAACTEWVPWAKLLRFQVSDNILRDTKLSLLIE